MFNLSFTMLIKVIIILTILIFLFQPIFIFAQEILIENAESVWLSDLETPTSDVLDSSDASSEKLIKYALVSHADSVWNSDLSTPASDVVDSSDMPVEKIITYAFVVHADTVSQLGLEGEGWKTPTDKWSFAIITDLHIGFDIPDYDGTGYNDNQAPQENYYLTERLKKIIERINYLKNIYNIKFVTVLGDVSDTAEYSEMLKVRNVLNNLSIPYIPLIGNHDVWPYTQKTGIDPDDRSKNNQATISNSANGDEYFEGIFWCSFPTLGESRDECLIKNTNIQKIKNLFGDTWKRQEEDLNFIGSPYLQNYYFKYEGINFISLDQLKTARNNKPGYVGEPFYLEYNDLTNKWFSNNIGSGPTLIFSHQPKKQWAFGSLPSQVYFSFAGHVHDWLTNDNDRSIDFWGSIITESTREEYKDVIRIVQIKNVENPTKGDIDYSKIEGIPENQASNGIKRPDPYINYSPNNPDFENNVSLSIQDEVNGGKISSCEWNFGDGNSTSSSAGNCQIYHKYEPYLAVLCREFNVKAVIKYNDNTQRITNEKIIRVCPNFKLELPPLPIIPISIFGGEITSANTSQSVILTKVTSPGKPVGMINIHFDEATEDINLSNLIIDTNLENQKPILYMPEWPNVIEEEKILFIPYNTEGSVYVCPEATSLEEINPRCPGKITLKLGETENGMTLSTTTYDNKDYYTVYGFKNGGGGVNLPPIVNANGSYQGDGGLPITLDAGKSSDPNNDPLQYRWDFDDDGTWDTEWLNTAMINHIWNNDYEGNVKLEVSDGEFSVTDTATVKVKSPKTFKEEAISELEGAKTGDKSTDKKIDLIIKHIQNSLNPVLWIDDSHLIFFKKENCSDSKILDLNLDNIDFEKMFEEKPEEMELQMKRLFKGKCFVSKLGIIAFNEEYASTKLMLQELKNKSKISERLKTVFKEAISKLIQADQLLAKIAIFDAKNTSIHNPKFKKIVEAQIGKAGQELLKAEKELEKSNSDKAILRLTKSWLQAQLAIEFAKVK